MLWSWRGVRERVSGWVAVRIAGGVVVGALGDWARASEDAAASVVAYEKLRRGRRRRRFGWRGMMAKDSA